MARGAVRPVRAAALTAVVVVATTTACGPGDGGVVDAGPVPTRAPVGEAGPGDGVVPPTPGAPTATGGTPGAVAGGGTTGAGGGTTVSTAPVSVYLTKGDSLHVVTRSVPKVSRIGAETMKVLLAGPTPAESRAGVGTAIPSSARFLGLNIDTGVARVALSPEFEAPAPGGQALRLAQVACTLDQFESIQGVRFVIDGEPVAVVVDGGSVVDRPVTCASYGSLLGR